MKRAVIVILTILLAVAGLLTVGEFSLLSKQNECIAYLETTEAPSYPIWDVPETETAEEREVRLARYQAATTEDGILLLLTFLLCPLCTGLSVVVGVISIKTLRSTPRKKKYLPILFLLASLAVLLSNGYVFICQTQI